MTDAVRVFVNEQPVNVAPGSSIRDAVAAFDPALAERLAAGGAYVTDGVGRRAAPNDAVSSGAIIRVVVSVRPPVRPSALPKE